MCSNCNNVYNLSDAFLKDLPPAFAKAMRDLHSGAITPADLSPELLTAISQELLSGIEIGLDIPEISNNPLGEAISENINVFSGFKTYQQLKEASLLLKDANGQLKPFTKFLQDVQGINENYNKNYLKAEYNHAVASGQMIANWQQIEARSDVAPFLKYKTAEDERVRDSHRGLNNVVKRVDDPFWNMYYPPNGWNCRCDVIQVISEEVTTDFDGPELPIMFRNNVGKDGIVFPDTHPYFSAVDKSVIPTIKANTAEVSKKVEKAKLKRYYDVLQQNHTIEKAIQEAGTKSLPIPYNKLDDVEKGVLLHYTGSGYHSVNEYLYSGTKRSKPNALLNAVEYVLNRALKKLKTDHQGIVMRGVSKLPQTTLKQYKRAFEKGGTVTHKSFTSTSTGKGFSGDVVFRIKSKRGKAIEDISEFPSEKEVLFKSNSKFKVTGYLEQNERVYVELEEF